MNTRSRRIKHALGLIIFTTGLHRILLRNRAVIVLFHRVDDELEGNPLSCTSTEFRQFCRFLQRHFEVISLGELLDRLEQGQPVGGRAVITFDDGYLDNHRAAAPILEEHGLPATFLLTTGFIGSSNAPWWDEELGITPAWMSWDDVADLSNRGFEIGAHTVTHPDLGKLEGPEAVAEMRESRERLEQAIGKDVPFFGYPFGRSNQMTDGNRDAVKRLGFRCCLSGYGGLVDPDSDPFHLRRWPVSPWHLSPYQFGWEMLFDRSYGATSLRSSAPPSPQQAER